MEFDPRPQPTPAVVERLRSHLQSGGCDQVDAPRRIAVAAFTDPTVAGAERRHVFGRVPVLVAHGSELAGAGAFLRIRLANNEALLVRQTDGSVRAFVNACRHRGSMVQTEQAGSCRALRCPYHGWTYALDGALRAVSYRDTFGPLDTDRYGLVELPAEERHGLVWVVDSPDVELDLDGWLGEQAGAVLEALRLEDTVCYRRGAFDEPANWKLLQDAFLDSYHLQFAHPRSAGPHFHTNCITVQDFGRHARFFAPRRSFDRHVADPDLAAPGGRFDPAAVLPDLTITHWFAPNVTMLRQPDHTQILSFFPHPSDPGRCRMEMRLLVPRLEATGLDEATWRRRWDRNWEILLEVLVQEDFPLLRSAQQALSSTAAQPMILGRNEVVNHLFHREINRLLEAAGG